MMKKTPSTDWLLEVPSARELSVIRDVEHGPMVAFADLCLPYRSRTYLNSLEYERDFKPGTAISRHEAIGSKLQFIPGATELGFEVYGWHADPSQSDTARNRFMALANPFFPDHADKLSVLETLSYRYAELASGLDRAHLSFTLRAIKNRVENYVHFDPDDYTSIAYLRGHVTHHIKYDEALLADMRNWEHDDLNYKVPTAYSARILAHREQTIAAWRGTLTGKASLHGHVGIVNSTRIICLASTAEHTRTPALTTAPDASLDDFYSFNSRYRPA